MRQERFARKRQNSRTAPPTSTIHATHWKNPSGSVKRLYAASTKAPPKYSPASVRLLMGAAYAHPARRIKRKKGER